MSSDLRNRFNKLIAAVFNMEVSGIRDDRGPHDIQAWDSLGQLNLILQVENEFEVTFDIEDSQKSSEMRLRRNNTRFARLGLMLIKWAPTMASVRSFVVRSMDSCQSKLGLFPRQPFQIG